MIRLSLPRLLAPLVIVAALTPFVLPTSAAEKAVIIAPPALDQSSADGIQTAVLAGGCFWGVQGVYQHTDGVVAAVSGYAGGTKESANYNMVSHGMTKHAEAVEIKYDPKKISYGKLLQIFYSVVHDPTQLNRQNYDVGPHYRSTIFPQNEEQKKIAEAYVAQLNAAKSFPKPIVTTIETDKPFYEAEEYHQDYMTLHPESQYIVTQDLPKVENLKKVFADRFRAKPVLVMDAKYKKG